MWLQHKPFSCCTKMPSSKIIQSWLAGWRLPLKTSGKHVQFIFTAYQPQTKIVSVKKLRWWSFKKEQAGSERLPHPSPDALRQPILRAHHQASYCLEPRYSCTACDSTPRKLRVDRGGWWMDLSHDHSDFSSRIWRDPQLQISENYSDLTIWRSTVFKYCWLMSHFIFNMFKRWYFMCW